MKTLTKKPEVKNDNENKALKCYLFAFACLFTLAVAVFVAYSDNSLPVKIVSVLAIALILIYCFTSALGYYNSITYNNSRTEENEKV